MYGLEGFGLMHNGYQGVTIRAAVLIPWLFGLCLRRRWRLTFGVILAEACLVWTLYGLGAGLLIVCAFHLMLFCKRRFFDGREVPKWWGNS